MDHPRIRGEHSARRRHQGLLLGSSPHTRGARLAGQRGDPGVGIIPAYAGSTKFRSPYYNAAQDHPRIRGEHLVVGELVAGERGSSPHTRGAPTGISNQLASQRIIPAYAGSTATTRGRIRSREDHPRIRGEHSFEKLPSAIARGSSPHTRGARQSAEWGQQKARIIPAYAGSTRVRSISSWQASDHPRIRGEHQDGFTYMPEAGGSSPHTRGALRDRRVPCI